MSEKLYDLVAVKFSDRLGLKIDVATVAPVCPFDFAVNRCKQVTVSGFFANVDVMPMWLTPSAFDAIEFREVA